MAKFSVGKIIERQRVVLYGPKGVGKTTLASNFPKPILLDVENGSGHLDIPRYGNFESYKEIIDTLNEISEQNLYKTVIIDTADWLELFIDKVNLAQYLSENRGEMSEKAKTVEEIPFGKGHARRKKFMSEFLKKLDVLFPTTTIVLLAHSRVVRVDPPDNMKAPYNRYEMATSSQAAESIGSWCDALLFMTREIIVEENKRLRQVKAKGGYQRIIYPDNTAFADAKNRWGLDEPFDADYAIIKPFVENGTIPEKAVVKTEQPPVKEPESENSDDDDIPMESKADVVFKLSKEIESDSAKLEEILTKVCRTWKWIDDKSDWRKTPESKFDKIIKAPKLFIKSVKQLLEKA